MSFTRPRVGHSSLPVPSFEKLQNLSQILTSPPGSKPMIISTASEGHSESRVSDLDLDLGLDLGLGMEQGRTRGQGMSGNGGQGVRTEQMRVLAFETGEGVNANSDVFDGVHRVCSAGSEFDFKSPVSESEISSPSFSWVEQCNLTAPDSVGPNGSRGTRVVSAPSCDGSEPDKAPSFGRIRSWAKPGSEIVRGSWTGHFSKPLAPRQGSTTSMISPVAECKTSTDARNSQSQLGNSLAVMQFSKMLMHPCRGSSDYSALPPKLGSVNDSVLSTKSQQSEHSLLRARSNASVMTPVFSSAKVGSFSTSPMVSLDLTGRESKLFEVEADEHTIQELNSKALESDPNDSSKHVLKVLDEILAVEEGYVCHLETFLNVVMGPMVMSSSHWGFSIKPEQARVIFSNIQQVYTAAAKFVHDLRPALGVVGVEAQLNSFISVANKHLQSFKIYAIYAANFGRSKAAVDEMYADSENPNLLDFLASMEHSRACNGNTLESYLMMPLDRVPRHILLLNKLLNKIEKIASENEKLDQIKTNIVTLLKKAEELSNPVQELTRKRENSKAIAKIQDELGGAFNVQTAGRMFVARSKVRLLASWSSESVNRLGEERDFFLFSDLLFYTSCSGILSSSLSINEIRLDAHTACEVVRDCCPDASDKPLLRVGAPSNLSFAIYGTSPVVLEFSSCNAMLQFKTGIEAIIHKEQLAALRRKQIGLAQYPRGSIAESRMEGYLLKYKVGRGLGAFKKRYCVLKNNVLNYYETAQHFIQNLQPIGQLSMRSCFFDFAPSGKYAYPALEVTCVELNCCYVFGAESKSELTPWLEYVRSVSCEGFEEVTPN